MGITSRQVRAQMDPVSVAGTEDERALCSAKSWEAVSVALGIASGSKPSVAWLIEDWGERWEVYCCISTHDGYRVALLFSERDDAFLRAAWERGDFRLQVEGTIPVRIPIRRDGALADYLEYRGLR
jgi:hypothetical protein